MAIDSNNLFLKAENVSLYMPLRARQTGGGLPALIRNKGGVQRIKILNDISLDLRPGVRLGLTGKNGAGKTTLLKILAGIYPPTTGQVLHKGKIQSLINIGLGMNPEASGLENIYLRGLYMGMPIKVMRALVDEIVEFSELEKSINNPLHTYSAGMKARLQLSIALSMNPEILLLDEWIGRGDREFQEKASVRLENFVQSAGIVVLASHSEKLLYRICNRLVEMENGQVIADRQLTDDERWAKLATPRDLALKLKREAAIREKRRIRILAAKKEDKRILNRKARKNALKKKQNRQLRNQKAAN